jgi:general secretion pathway protein G
MVVMVLIVVLASIAVPTYHVAIVRAREAVLRDDLYTMRKLIDQYTIDKQQPPQTLQDLVDSGYLRGGIPTDPFTARNDSWQVETEEVPLSNEQSGPGIVDVHSGASQNSLDGTPYSSW